MRITAMIDMERFHIFRHVSLESHGKHSARRRRQALHQATQSLITTEEEEREDVIWPLSGSDAEIISANQYHLLHEFMRDILGTATHRRGSYALCFGVCVASLDFGAQFRRSTLRCEGPEQGIGSTQAWM